MRLSRFYPAAIFLVLSVAVFGQQPLSFQATLPPAPKAVSFVLPESEKTENFGKSGQLPVMGKTIAAELSIRGNGQWDRLGDQVVWRLKIAAPGAQGILVYPDSMLLPEGGKLFIYSTDKKLHFGPYTHSDNPEGGSFALDLVATDEIILEYNAPAAMATPSLHINEIGYAYRMVKKKSDRDFGGSGSCEVNVNCPEGADWLAQKNSVARILLKISNTFGWCSGALINNARLDCTPYILSADHCYQDDQTQTTASTSDLNQWKFYFKYESGSCANPAAEPASKVFTGCTFTANSNDNGGATGSDFVLLKLKSTPADSLNLFYAGWDASGAAADSGVGIHHPEGDIKKISTFKSRLTSDSYGNTVANTHWSVTWNATSTGHGVTEQGSSGSPIFNAEHLVVGALTGGYSKCADPTQPDYYGKLSYSWISNGIANNRRLKPWLDPDNTGLLKLNGSYRPCQATGIALTQETPIFRIAPNPVSDIVEIFTNANGQSINIFSNLGQLMFSGRTDSSTSLAIHTNLWPEGVYFVTVSDDQQHQATQKLLVVH
ncbi:MAG: T9SS type A sorting domain-containing protein [Chitinophagales bacterium]